MRWLIAPLAVVATTLGTGTACMPKPVPEPPPKVVPALDVRARVTDVEAFEAFIATHPTPGRFRAEYPGITLVLPGDIATKELRLDRSRYFAELDEEGRIIGGRFS
ncbi:hypothetical protein JN531_008070 [Flagellatimonas centrodinii]|uniref:hypothetical protein n=1 Tax=Flagellatimonas centrodinii TaxID=2806210 RepID=UPI001FF8B427|nr:hypothetical protein [Flagellatimonas centrodinii]ULQ48241.1 hypothetical protein JN531_008070 [Flagellatimonas centrodinii]